MKLETERLNLIPLTFDQEQKYLASDFSLEKSLGLKEVERQVPEPLKKVIENIILPNLKDSSKNHLFHTTWLIIDRENKTIVGSFGFKSEPNDKGEVEIGYGTESNFQGQGFMTEAISGLIKWTKLQKEIEFLVAETDIENLASQKILTNNNFTISECKNTMIWWKLNLRINE
jgi:[ribosomal protein S5]-alanine N-acetyltransferase